MPTRDKIRFDFMGRRRTATILSLTLLLISMVFLSWQQLSFGLDFSGGALVEVEYPHSADPEQVRLHLEEAGYEQAVVVHFGSEQEILIRLPRDAVHTSGADLLAVLARHTPQVQLRRLEFVGPQVGAELREKGGLALLTALGLVMLYIAFRFQLKFAVGAVTALFHDVLITLGFFAVFRWEFDLTVLAALLAVIGYSLNDTIVVSDRIRENFRQLRQGAPEEIINISLNQTLGRTLITSLTTLMVLMALLLAGGELIRGFAMALGIGVLVGTYSSIYVAANMLLLLNISRDDLVVKQSEIEAP